MTRYVKYFIYTFARFSDKSHSTDTFGKNADQPETRLFRNIVCMLVDVVRTYRINAFLERFCMINSERCKTSTAL